MKKYIKNISVILKGIFSAIIFSFGVLLLNCLIFSFFNKNTTIDAIGGIIGVLSNLFTIIGFLETKINKKFKLNIKYRTIYYTVLIVSFLIFIFTDIMKTIERRRIVEIISIEIYNKKENKLNQQIPEKSAPKKFLLENKEKVIIIINPIKNDALIIDSLKDIIISVNTSEIITPIERKEIKSLPIGEFTKGIIVKYDDKLLIERNNFFRKVQKIIIKIINLFRGLFHTKEGTDNKEKFNKFFSGMLNLFDKNDENKFLAENKDITNGHNTNLTDSAIIIDSNNYFNQDNSSNDFREIDTTTIEKPLIISNQNDKLIHLKSDTTNSYDQASISITQSSNNRQKQNDNSNKTIFVDTSKSKSFKTFITNKEPIKKLNNQTNENLPQTNNASIITKKEELNNNLFKLTDRNKYPIIFNGIELPYIIIEFENDSICNTTFISKSKKIKYKYNITRDKKYINILSNEDYEENKIIETMRIIKNGKKYQLILPYKNNKYYYIKLIN